MLERMATASRAAIQPRSGLLLLQNHHLLVLLSCD
jgi:hypothetical protein